MPTWAHTKGGIKGKTTDITLYTYFRHYTTNNHTIVRSVLHDVSWIDRSIEITTQTGNQISDDATILIPVSNIDTEKGKVFVYPDIERVIYDNNGNELMRFDPWNRLSASEVDKYWTIDLRHAANTRIVLGISDFEFTLWPPGTNPQAIPAGLSLQQQQFDNPVSGVIGARRPKDVNYRLDSSLSAQFVQVRV